MHLFFSFVSIVRLEPMAVGDDICLVVTLRSAPSERLRCEAVRGGPRDGTLHLRGVAWIAVDPDDPDSDELAVWRGRVTHCARNFLVETRDVARCVLCAVPPPAWEPAPTGYDPDFFVTVVLGERHPGGLRGVLGGGYRTRLAVAARAVLMRDRYPRSGLRLAECLLRRMPWSAMRRAVLRSAKLRVLLPLAPACANDDDEFGHLDWMKFRFPHHKKETSNRWDRPIPVMPQLAV